MYTLSELFKRIVTKIVAEIAHTCFVSATFDPSWLTRPAQSGWSSVPSSREHRLQVLTESGWLLS